MAIGKSRRDSLLSKGKQALQGRKQDQQRDSKRRLFLESLEDRRLLTVGPQLIGIQPNDGELLPFDSEHTYIRDSAPRDLTFRFDENQVFNSNDLDGIQITRTNLDGDFTPASVTSTFNTGGLVEVQFTAAKLGIEQNGIQLVFSKRDQGGAGAPEIGVVENRVEISLNTNPGNESTVSDLLTALSQNSDASALVRATVVAGDAGTDIATPSNSYSPLVTAGANDVVIEPGYIGVGDSPNEIIVRFSETLPDDLYQIDVYGEGKNALRNNLGMAVNDVTLDSIDNGSDVSTQFELDLGAQIISVVPQPITRALDGALTQNKNQILLFFNDDDLDIASAQNPDFYQLIRTNDTTESTDDISPSTDPLFRPTLVEYNVNTDSALLTFASDLDQLAGSGAFRLRVGTNEVLPTGALQIAGTDSPTNDFATAQELVASDLELGGVLISGEITETENYPIDLPGDSTDPGHRQIDVIAEETDNVRTGGDQSHVPTDSADENPNITTLEYCFQDDLGMIAGDSGPQPAYNNITEEQKKRTREILEQISGRTGTQFIETESSGFIVATGDLAVIGMGSGPGGVLGVAGPILVDGETRSLVIMDDAEDWSDEFGGSWYQTAVHEIGHQLGLTHAYDLPAHTVMGRSTVNPNYGPAALEDDFPGDHDIVHLNHLHRPESRDIDLYKFTLTESGLFTAETIAERLRDNNENNLVLNSALTLFRENTEDGSYAVVAQNDDYFSNDSYVELNLSSGTYFMGVSSTGNTAYDPTIPDSGFYGTSAGAYQLKMNFRPNVDVASGNVLVDADNPIDANRPEIIPTAFDGDSDGLPGGVFNFWFRAAAETDGTHTPGEARTIFVDKSAADGGDGTLATPFNNLRDALNVSPTGVPNTTPDPASVQEGDILRVVSNAGSDGDIRTELDNLAYEIGFDDLGNVLDDGAVLEIPKGVMVQIDAGTIMKMRRSWIGVGSTSPAVDRDRSGGAIQILGAPNFVDQLGNLVPETGDYADAMPLQDLDDEANESAVVHFTSYNDESLGLDTFTFSTEAVAGDWGGILIHHGVDGADQTRFDYAKNGVFLNHINHADIRFGGGQVLVESVSQIIDPIEIVDSRPTISHNEISYSRNAAIAASPDSFKESNFHSPEYQEEFTNNPFTVDYKRIGPDIYGNRVHNNTTNGLAIRVSTLSGDQTQKLTVPGRLDDTDITHVLQENLVLESTPGGPFKETEVQSLQLVTLIPRNLGANGSLANGTYAYKMVFVDKNGNESLATDASRSITITASENAVELNQLLTASGDFVARRLYRQANGAGSFELIATINQTDTRFVDDGTTLNGTLDETAESKLRPRFDARLSIDPAVVLKLDGAHIHAEVGAQIIAEGRDGHEVVITSILDDRYGAGSTFDASNDGTPVPGGVNEPRPGAWGGIYASPESTISIDNAVIAYAGGVTPVEGTFTAFNAIEVHSARARIANSVFEFNAGGFGGQAPASRYGRGTNEESVIFVRSAQPVIVDNTFRNNVDDDSTTRISAISINVNSLNHELLFDYGRSTGETGALGGYRDNHGPLVVGNRLSNNEINGMVIRGEVLTTQSIWDDTDITNVLFDNIVVPDFHTYGGLRLQSNPTQSLVVKLEGGNAGFDVTGRPLEIEDRIGGTIQIIGQPKSPVVITSLKDDSVGAGIQPNGDPMVDTNNDGEYDPSDYVDQSTTRVNLNFGPAMQNNAAAMQTAQRAADFWSSVLADDVTIEFDIDFVALGTGIAGTMSPVVGNMLYDSLRDSMIADAQPHEIIVSQLPVFMGLTTDGADVGDTVSVTRANMKALGLTGLPAATSAYGGGQIDGTMQISDSYDNAAADFLQIAIHEIGHALGFISGVGNVDAGAGITNLTTLDMFRLAPGQGVNNFTDAPRVLDPTKDQVFYDGGYFDPSRISTIAGLTRGDIPLSTGVATGDGFQPSHFKNRNLINGVYLGTMDPVANPAATENASENDKRVLDLIGWDVIYAGPASPGDWNTVLIDQYAHDRNVAVVVESESRDVNAPGPNATALKAQFLGELAPDQKAGDDNRRLGFEVSGFLANPQDIDVFSFEAEAGTEVYVDIDRTTHTLDSVIELIDSNDQILARSVNSLAETNANASLHVHTSMQDKVQVMIKDDQPFGGKDYWAINPRDPGLRMILPGPFGTRNTYHLRVRSNTPEGTAIDDLTAGTTAGAYSMQLRLQALDEVAGSMIQYASIGYATTGITVVGQPIHSFLGGETTEVEIIQGQNDSLAQAQNVGNLLQSDRGVISVSGQLNPSVTDDTDVDFFRFTIDAQEMSPGANLDSWPVILDIDYADGLGRPNTNLAIFDSNGALIYWSEDSNVADDRPRPNVDNQVEDLTRGSVGTSDPLIGPINLVPGEYFAVVSAQGHSPLDLVSAIPRLEPISSIGRVAEDHLESLLDGAHTFLGEDGSPVTIGAGRGTLSGINVDHNVVEGLITQWTTSRTRDQADQPILFDNESVIPWILSDVTLYGAYSNHLALYDPFTGVEEVNFDDNDFGELDIHIRDIGVQFDGTMHSISTADFPVDACNPQDSNVRYIEIDPTTGTASVVGAVGLQTFRQDPDDPENFITARECGDPAADVGVGVDFEAMYFGALNWTNAPGLERLLAVGNRNDFGQTNNGVQWTENLVYELDPETGAVMHTANKTNPDRDPREFQASTNAWPVGRIQTGPELSTNEATFVNPFTLNTDWVLGDGDFFTLDTGTQVYTFEFDFGPEVRQNLIEPGEPVDVSRSIRDGFFWVLDPDSAVDDDESVFEFDTGSVIAFNTMPIEDGVVVTVTDNQFPAESQSFEFDNSDPADLTLPGATRIEFGVGDNADSLADKLKDAINANGDLSIVATQVGPRVSLINDESISITLNGVNYSGDAVRKEGAAGGSAILHIKDPSQLQDGDTFSVTDEFFSVTTWEFNDVTNPGAGVTPGNEQIDFDPADTPLALASKVELAIMGNTINTGYIAHRGNDRIAIIGPETLSGFGGFSTTALPAAAEFDNPLLVEAEEHWDRDQVAISVQALSNITPFEIGAKGDRLNFLGAEVGDFSGVTPWIDQLSSGGVAQQSVNIGLLAHDEGRDYADPFDLNVPPAILDGIATKIADAINGFFNGQVVEADANGDNVSITGAIIDVSGADGLNADGNGGPGGLIKGMAGLKDVRGRTDSLFAVSDNGGLYQIFLGVNSTDTLFLVENFVESSKADLNGINFTGLTAGPQNLEDGRYADLLFGIDEDHVVYAFNTAGELQPVFADGSTTIQLDTFGSPMAFAGDPVGLIFGNLDTNLFWNQILVDDAATQQNETFRFNTQLEPYFETADLWDQARITVANQDPNVLIDKRQDDPGHGITPSPDGTREEALPGHTSLHFGRGHVGGDPRSYDYLGGAHGTMVSNEFSLIGKSPADKPTMYFNYFLGNEGNDTALISISDNGGEWRPLTSLANSNGSWLQRRVDLSNYAGIEHLRLRVDFSTSAAVVNPDTAGSELRAIEGRYLRDGDSFSLDAQVTLANIIIPIPGADPFELPGPITLDIDGDLISIVNAETIAIDFAALFGLELENPVELPIDGTLVSVTGQFYEFESGFTFVAPSGGAIEENSTFDVEDQNGSLSTFEFASDAATVTPGNVHIQFDTTDSAADIASRLSDAIEAEFPAFDVHQNGERVNYPVDRAGNGPQLFAPSGATPISEEFIEGQAGLNFDIEETPPVSLNLNPHPIFVHEGMTRTEVADEINISMEPAVYNPVLVVEGGVEYQDGETFILTDGVVDPITNLDSRRVYEFEAGFVVDIPTDGALGVADGDLLIITNAADATSATFEFDNDATITPGNIQVAYVSTSRAIDLANALTDAINGSGPAAWALNAQVIDGPRVQIHSDLDTLNIDALSNLSFDANSVPGVGIDLEVVSSGADLVDGDTIVFTVPGTPDTTTTFEFDFGGGVTGTNIPVAVNLTDSPEAIAQALDTALGGLFTSSALEGRFLRFANESGLIVDSSLTTPPAGFGGAGVMVRNHEPVRFIPGDMNFASDIAVSVTNAINATSDPLDIQASDPSVTGAAQRRIALNHTSLRPIDIGFTDNTGGDIQLEMPVGDFTNDIVKQHNDMLRIVGHRVTDAGPIGLAVSLIGDRDVAGLANNDHEGLYLDDFVIGFAERGEMVTLGTGNSAYDGDPVGVSLGEYQLEIRRASSYLVGTSFNDTFDTNDRHTQAFRIEALDGSDIADGDTFTLTDGIHQLTFEFNDEAAAPTVTPGHFEIAFNSEMRSWEVAIRIRDAINRPEVFAVLDVTAALSDGTDGLRFADDDDGDSREDLRFDVDPLDTSPILSSSLVDLHGDVYILGWAGPRFFDTVFEASPEPSEMISQAIDTGINGSQSRTFISTGSIGDNQELAAEPSRDIDLFRVQLSQDEEIQVQVGIGTGSTLDPVISIYDPTILGGPTDGEIIASRVNDFGQGQAEEVTFVAPATGTYYVAVSGVPEAPLPTPLVDIDDGIDTPAALTTGFYTIEITTGSVQSCNDFGNGEPPNDAQCFEVFDYVESPPLVAGGPTELNESSDLRGDSNHPRQQGQILLQGNRITNSQTYGIHIEGGNRIALDGNAPHQGSVRHLDELNDEGLVPGVTVTNNLITYSGVGGIRFSGDTNGAGLPDAPVPFGRIINNTIVGIGGTLMTDIGGNDVGIQVDQNASPTLLNNIIANTTQGINVDPSSNTTVVGATLYKGNLTNTNYSGEDFAISLANTDPLFVDPRLGVNNFYLEPGTPINPNRAIDSSVSSLGERFEFNLVKDPIGLAPSPIIAPVRDVTGQLRVDDPAVEPPNGLGTNVFIDRGAMDRADFSGPTAALINPKDNDADGIDQNSGHTVVNLGLNAVVSSFEIRLNDGLEPADPNEGVGIADNTVTTETVVLRRNGEILYDGIDYSFSYNETSDTVRLTPLSGIWTQDRIYTIELANTDHWKLVSEAGANINDGDSFKILDLNGNEADFEFERGYSLAVPQTLELQIPEEAGGLGGIVDGEVFSLRVGTNAPVVFEFDRDGDFTVGRTPILYTVNSTLDEIADGIVAALTNAGLGANAVNLGEGRIHVGSNINHILDTSLTSLTQTGVAGGVADGDYFTVDDGTKIITFEFENTEVGDGPLVADPAAGDVVIEFTTEKTHIELADIISDAINAEDLDLETATLTGGIVHVGGTIGHLLNAANSNLLQQGSPGVRPEFGIRIPTAAGQITGLEDGQTFVVQYGTSAPVTFELNNLEVDPSVTLGNTRIDFNNSTSVNQLAQEIVIALKGSGLNLDPQIVPGTSLISFGARPQHSLDVSNTALIKVGDPTKPAAVPVNILPLDSFDGTQTAMQIIKAIRSDQAEELLDGVMTMPTGADQLMITGALNVSTFSNAFLADDWDVQTPREIKEIEDLATNPLKANQLSGETMYTIQLGTVDYDMGDAPDGNGVAPQNAYPTVSGHNPAIHMSGSTIFMGERVDRDGDGQPVVEDDHDGDGYLIDTSSAAGIATDNPTNETPANLVISSIDVLTVTVDGNGIVDDDILSVGDTDFQLETSGVDPGNGNVFVDISASDSINDIAGKIANAINAETLAGVTAAAIGAEVQITSTEGTVVDADAATGIDAAAQRAHVTEGETFTISGNGNDYTVELDSDDVVINGNIQAGFEASDTADDVAATITQALIDANIRLNLNPIVRPNGRVEITGDDADGVTGPLDPVTGVPAPIGFFNPYVFTELVVMASQDSLLDAWIDYNRDGDWDDPNEQIAAAMQLTTGENSLSVKAPLEPDSVPGQTFARFRISDVGGLRPTGLTINGEIEDYEIQIVDGRPPEAINDPSVATAGFATTEDIPLPVGAVDPSVLDNDTDANGNDIRVDEFDAFSAMGATVTVDQNWKSAGASSGTFEYDPTLATDIQALYEGEVITDTFTYTLVEDTTTPNSFGFPSQTAATVSITLTGVNDAPVSQDIPLAAFEDGNAITASFVSDDVDNDDDADSLTYSIVTNLSAGQGTVANNGDGTFTFVPGGDFQELAQDEDTDVVFTYKATDQHGLDSNVSTVTITVTGVNDAPTAVADVRVVDQDIQTDEPAAGVLTNDLEPDTNDSKVVTKLNGTDLDSVSGSLTMTSTRGAEFTLNADGSFSYDPRESAELKALDPGDSVEDQFTYTMSDPHGETSQTTITFTVNGVNDVPVATDDSYATGQTQPLDIDPAGVLGNDSDADADDSISVSQLNGSTTLTGSSAEGATVTILGDGSFTYNPISSATLAALVRGETLNDTFTYTVEDSAGAASTATVTVVVTGENKDPIAVADDFLGIDGVSEDNTLLDPTGVLANDTDEDDPPEALFVSGVNGTGQLSGQSAKGALITMNADGTFLYDPREAAILQSLADGVTTTDTFEYTVSDGQGGQGIGTVTIEVTGVNDAPVANEDSALGPRNAPLVIDVLENDTDVDGTIDVVTITDQPDPGEGNVTVNPADNTVTFQPATDFSGTTEFKYELTDDFGAVSNEVTVTVEINDAPIAEDDSTDAYQDVFNTPTVIDVLANDLDLDGTLDPGTVTVVVEPQHGSVTVDADGSIVYQPETTPTVYTGPDSLQYTVSDDDGEVSNVATVSINVIPDPYPWHNRSNGLDVNNDGFVSPLDALLVISELNESGSYTLPEPSEGVSPPPFFDVNENGTIEPGDAIQIINYLNANANGEGEGEFVDPDTMDISVVAEQMLEGLDAHDNNGFAVENLQMSGLSQVRSEILEDLLSEIADDGEETTSNALDDFFGQF